MIPSRLSKKPMSMIQDNNDLFQVLWELSNGYDWSKRHPEEIEEKLSTFPAGINKEQQAEIIRTLQNTPVFKANGETIYNDRNIAWLDSIKEVFPSAIEDGEDTMYNLVKGNLRCLQTSSEYTPGDENRVLGDLWNDFLMDSLNEKPWFNRR